MSPQNCPLLKEFNLKLVNGPPSTATTPAPGGPPAPHPVAPVAPAPALSPGGSMALADILNAGSTLFRSHCY